MTLRKPQPQPASPSRKKRSRWGSRERLRRKRRHNILETLEKRQLLAGPDIIGIQPNDGSLLFDGTVLNVSPRELVFRFDDDTVIDPDTLSGIRITRAGEDRVFESASATTDLGTAGAVLLEFRAAEPGSLGNGITVSFTSSIRPNPAPVISTVGRAVTIDLSSNPINPTRVQDLLSGVANDPAASALIEIIQVSGSSLGVVGTTVEDSTLTLQGANAAQAVTDFGTNGAVRVRLVSTLSGVDGRDTRLEIEQRNFGGPANPVIVVTDQVIRVQLNSAPGFETTAADFITAINNNPDSSPLIIASLEQGEINTTIGDRPTNYSPITLSGVSDVVVNPGFIGLGESDREVVFRFAEPLPDDIYQIDILGTGTFALRNQQGEPFQDGVNLTRTFSINLGPQVVAVVPEPVRRNSDGSLSPDTGVVEVHFNDDDLLPSLAENPSFYQLIFTRDSVNNTDDVVVNPASVDYNNITNIATLDFQRPLSRIPDPLNPSQFIAGAARLRVGASEDLPNPPTEVSLLLNPNDPVEPGDSFDQAFDLNTQWTIGSTTTQSARLTSEIFNPEPFGLDLPGPDLPGTRTIRPGDPTRLERTVPLDYVRNGADVGDGVTVIQYDFAPSWLGDDPNRPGIVADTTYFNLISEQQKERVREVLQLFSEYLGVSFVEVEGEPTSATFFSIAVGDLYGGDERTTSGQGNVAVVTRDRNLDGVDDLGVLDFQDFDESIDDQFGDEFFRGAMFVVGQLLGYGYADDLPQPVSQSTDFIFTPGTDNEPAFPSVADIVHGQYLYRPDSTDIDLYRFEVDTPGQLAVETIAERLGVPSLLDTALRLYRADGTGSFEEIAQNDDYFSNDSLINIQVTPGTYIIGVSAKGNSNYDPNIVNSGFGGRSEGEYELRIDFRPNVTNSILDTTSIPLDGDADGRPGGFFDFWFVPNDANNTLYVDKVGVTTGGQLGTVGNPYTQIDQAIAAARPGDTIRVVGNGGIDGRMETFEDNFSYQIGFSNNAIPLVDGSTLELPQGVRMIIDSGAILKLSRSRIAVGSTSPAIDVSDSALQILGTPTIVTSTGLPARDAGNTIIPGSVFLTSTNDDSVGNGNISGFTPAPRPGDWGGIDFRGDLDSADEIRRNRELEGVFLNHVQFADIKYGGGAVSIGGRQVVVSPIDMAITRPTIINSRITRSADAAMAATPDTFAETRFSTSIFQILEPFTPDYTRIGPEIHGNFVDQNSINGLFIRLATRTGDELETLNLTARMDDVDIPHVLTENLVIEGTPGGPILQSSAPSSLLVRLNPVASGNVPAGTYVYRITNVSRDGLESAASQPTLPVTLAATGGVQLNQLPTVDATSDFVSRRLYRALVDPVTQLPGDFSLVAQLNASNTSFTDIAAVGIAPLPSTDVVLRSRLDASLVIDPGTVVKVDGARIEARFGANMFAEGSPSEPIVFTSIEDQRYGGGGTYDTNNRGDLGELNPGDWGGIYIGHGSTASIDNAVIAGAGGTTRIEGGFASFNAIEVHQANLRLANSTLEENANGRGDLAGTRVGRGDNGDATVFVRASQPIIINNKFINGDSPALSFDVNSLNHIEVYDQGRSTGLIDDIGIVGNSGPLIEDNSLTGNTINGLQVRGGQLATEGVWDDVNIVHVVTESIEIPNQHIFGGLRLQSDARGSLVVKFQSDEGETAGIVVGGTLLTAADELRDIPDRIGGSLQLVGHPDFPVVLTSLADDFAGAGFTRDGRPQVDTNNDGLISAGGELGGSSLPTGPEVNNGTTIDNDVDVNFPGFFEATITDGNDVGFLSGSGVTVEDLTTGQILIDQDFVFQYSTFIETGGTTTQLSQTTITQPAMLIADDLVESRGTFAGPNGDVNWIAQSRFNDGVSTLFSTLRLESTTGELGDIRVISYLDEDVLGISDDILVTSGTPGFPDFRAFTIDGPLRVGFSHGGFYEDDGSNQQNATYAGWAADQFPQLETAILNGTAAFSVPGQIDVVDLPPGPDPNFGTQYGPNDVTTAFAWDVISTESSAIVTSFLELLAADPAVRNPFLQIEKGVWDGVKIREAASDRNVASIAEEEPVRTSVFNTNAIPSQSQFLGELAPSEQAGDENRRLGFVVNGSITTRDDLDVYSFIAESATEVWLDIDRTGNQLDSVVELIDANGRILASSNDSLLAETNPNAIFIASDLDPDAAKPLAVVPERLESTELTVTESIVEATGGSLVLSITGSILTADVPVDAFLLDPAEAIETALESQYPELGDITASLNRRQPRVVDPDTGAILRAGEDFVIQLRFDASLFVGRSVPRINISAATVTGAIVGASSREVLFDSQLQDTYSINPKDAGMRIRLPGEVGTRNLYHVRVRSANTTDPLDLNTLVNGPILAGRSIGSYELQIRLGEQDESPGTQVRLADIRFAANGIQIIGQPLHSPLIGEEYETEGPNDALVDAQPLGYFGVNDDLNNPTAEAGLLQSDRLSKAFAGVIDSPDDVDWYSFEVRYENLTRDEAPLYLSTIFDLDYADNFARSDMAFYVFDELGQLIYVGRDSNVADDLPGAENSNDTTDLSRGSAGSEDPYIGATELGEGTYFVAISNQSRVPLPLDQFFNPASANPLLRLEPIDSVQRIAEDRIGSFGGGTATDPEIPLLFDSESIVEYTFDDVLLFVNTVGSLQLVNPFTGENFGQIGLFGDEIRDIAFHANGELYAYSGFNNRGPGDDNWFYYQISTENASLDQVSVGGLMDTLHWSGTVPPFTPPFLDVNSDDGVEFEAITIREYNGLEAGYAIGNRPTDRLGLQWYQNIVYSFDHISGAVSGPPRNFIPVAVSGAGTTVLEVGHLNTVPPDTAQPRQLGISGATEIGPSGVGIPQFADGDTFTLSNGIDTVTFELDQSFTFVANGTPVRDGDAIEIDGTIFEYDTGQRIQLDQVAPVGNLSEGATIDIVGDFGQAARFEFVRLQNPQQGNIGIPTVDPLGQPLAVAGIAANLANQINANIVGVDAVAVGDEIFFTGTPPSTLTTNGLGVSILGSEGTLIAGSVGIDVIETIAPDALIDVTARAVRNAGIAVSAAGTQFSLPNSGGATIVAGTALSLNGSPGVGIDNQRILILPTDSAEILGERIQTAIEDANAAGLLDDVNADAQGRSLSIVNTNIVDANGGFFAGGVARGGLIQGTELVNDQLYALDALGGLYVVTEAELEGSRFPPREIGRYISRATDLAEIGIQLQASGEIFTGLRAGPASVQDAELRNILFGITSSGDIYAFNTFGELQPVFAGGRSMISTGIGGALGLDFSTLDYNLWHATGTRGGDAGHGINAIDNNNDPTDDYRGAVAGGTSLAFTYEGFAHNGNYASPAEFPFAPSRPRRDGQGVNLTYNFPGGAKGVMESNSFDLEGYSADDQPTLYFNYYLDNDASADRLRFYVVTEEGVEHLVTSNTTARGGGTPDDEFDDPFPAGVYEDEIDVNVQQLFDNTNFWRQARIPLNEFAGLKNLTLRVEYSTAGTTDTGSSGFRAVSGELLSEGDELVINNEPFALDLAPTVSTPSGIQLAALYSDPNATAVLTIDGQQYVLNNGTRVIAPGQISIDVLALSAPGTTLEDLSAVEVANAVAEGVRIAPPPNAVISGFDFSDPEDDPTIGTGQNDLIYEATPLPYTSGNLTITGTGRFGTDPTLGSVSHIDDVELLRVDVLAGSTITVDVDLDFNTTLDAVVRFFDANGDEVFGTFNSVLEAVQYTPPVDGTVFIGISGLGNDTYDPRLPGSTSNGQVDSYTASVSINGPLAILTEDNLIEFNGLSTLTATPSDLFTTTGTAVLDQGLSINISRAMTADDVAEQVQRAVAGRFSQGDLDDIPVSGPIIRFPGLTVNDPGPFANEADRYGDLYASGQVAGAVDNDHEGVYLDDFIIGFAERGEVATGSNVVSDPFVIDQTPNFPVPADPTTDLLTGSYQAEIRDGTEYVASGFVSQFDTITTNERLTEARSISALGAVQLQDGFTFSIFDGRSTVEFEFDLVESNTGVTPGRVRIPYTLQFEVPGSEDINPVTGLPIPGTGVIRPETEAEVAFNIIDAINRSDVQSVINVRALPGGGVDADTDPTINLFGDVVVIDEDGSLASVDLGIARGDTNRDRVSQGVILVENSRLLYNELYGVDISHDVMINIDGTDVPSAVRYPRNLVELNTESLKPGVVVRSSVFAFNGVGGLQITGIDPAATESLSDPVPFERIVNNTIIGGVIQQGTESPGDIFEGILFPQGNISFADVVVDYNPSVGGAPPAAIHQAPNSALGAPDNGGRGTEPIDGTTTVSLGRGGTLTVQFTDNLLTGSGTSAADLVILETGEVESVRVEISRDGISFFDVGIVGGLTSGIDIDAAGFTTQDRFAFVRLTDLFQGDNTGTSLGADIDSIGAISTVSVETYTPQGTGINIVGNAAPALLNNVIANSADGVLVDPTNGGIVLGGNSFFRNVNNVPAGVSLGEFPQILTDPEVVFVGAAELIFAPGAGSSIIDSSIDSLEDRPSLTTVRNPLGIPPSPILAPRFDVNGQLRVDDPNVETPGGLGERVFKDRGASDRGDLAGPRVFLLSPSAPEIGVGAGNVTVFGAAPQAFEVQIVDGLPPADVVPGTGVDDRTVNSGSLLLLKDNVALVEGVDYRFGYNPSTNIIRLTPIAGVWEQDSTYVIRMIDASDAIIAATDGVNYNDGDRLNLLDLEGDITSFEYEGGISLIFSTSLSGGLADGITVDLFDGTNISPLMFELDNDGIFDPERIPVAIPAAGTPEQFAEALANAINATPALSFTANLSGNVVQLLGGTPLSTAVTNSQFINVDGALGTSIGFGIQIPVEGASPDPSFDEGQTFIVRRGAIQEVLFEFDDDGVIDNDDAIPVIIPVNPTLDQIADAMVRAIGGAGLGLSPENAGFGRVFLGGDTNYSVDLTGSTLLQLGVPGEGPTIPIIVEADQPATEIAKTIQAVIDAQQLDNVVTSIVDVRVLIEGTGGVNGTGAVDLITVQDEVGNQLQSNQANGRTELTIFIGSGFDYGDAPSPYTSLDVDGGPRHAVDPNFSFGPTVSADSNAKLVNVDDDDGITIPTVLQAGFSTNIGININNATGRTFYVDVWFDWNGNGQFENTEALRFGSVGTNRSVLAEGDNIISVAVPSTSNLGEIYGRFRLSESPTTTPVGDATSGEVEDYRIFVSNNPFQNPSMQHDVNANGAVTPIDALQVINLVKTFSNAYEEAFGVPKSSIDLNDPADLGILNSLSFVPEFPDVNGNGVVSVNDANAVISELNRLYNGEAELIGGEGEAVGNFVPVTGGVLASRATVLGDALIDEASRTEQEPSTIQAPEAKKTSVFDDPAVVQLDSLVDSLAEDMAATKDSDSGTESLDRVFAGL